MNNNQPSTPSPMQTRSRPETPSSATEDEPTHSYADCIDGVFEPYYTKQMHSLLSVFAHSELVLQTKRKDERIKDNLATYLKLADDYLMNEGVFGEESFGKFRAEFLEPVFRASRKTDFSLGALLQKTKPNPNKPFKCIDGQTIMSCASTANAQFKLYETIWEGLLVNGDLPSGWQYPDMLERVRAAIWEKKQGNDDDDDNDDDGDASGVPNKFLPTAWWVFIYFGQYGQHVYDTTPLSLHDSSQGQDKNKQSRNDIRAQGGGGKRAKLASPQMSVDLLRELIESSTAIAQANTMAIAQAKIQAQANAHAQQARSQARESKLSVLRFQFQNLTMDMERFSVMMTNPNLSTNAAIVQSLMERMSALEAQKMQAMEKMLAMMEELEVEAAAPTPSPPLVMALLRDELARPASAATKPVVPLHLRNDSSMFDQ